MLRQADDVGFMAGTPAQSRPLATTATKSRSPVKRAKSAEVYERVIEVAQWLGAGLPDWKAKKQIQSKWGVGHRQAMNYLLLARKRLIEAIGKPTQELRAEAYARYMKVFDDDQAKPADWVRANKGIVELLGLAAPTCLRIQDDPTEAEQRANESRKMEAMLAELDPDTIRKIEEAAYRAEQKQVRGGPARLTPLAIGAD